MVTPAMGAAMMDPTYFLRENGAKHGYRGFHWRLSTLHGSRQAYLHNVRQVESFLRLVGEPGNVRSTLVRNASKRLPQRMPDLLARRFLNKN